MLIELGQWIQDILEEHVEELVWLWPARQAALLSPEDDLTTLGRIERRIAAHTDALVLAGENAVPLLVTTIAEDEESALAATVTLLELGSDQALLAVVSALETVDSEVLGGIRTGLCLGPIEGVAEDLRRMVASDMPAGVAAAEALAFHRDPAAADAAATLTGSSQPERQEAGWRIVALLALEVDANRFADGVRSEHSGVRRAALEAAAWQGNPGALAACRRLANAEVAPALELLELLATLGTPGDLDTFRALGADRGLGPHRFGVLASFGHPAVVDLILQALEDSDALTAATAGAAFQRMTGLDVASDERVAVPSDDGGAPLGHIDSLGHEDSQPEEEHEPPDPAFEEDVRLPDAGLAQRLWAESRDRWSAASRIVRGQDASLPPGAPGFDDMDLLSRRQAYLRGRYRGLWEGGPADLDRFPQAWR